MKKRMILTVQTSCDEQFIERVANQDPFDYWNRCIVPGTAKQNFYPFWLDDVGGKWKLGTKLDGLGVKITKMKDAFPTTHQITYSMERPYSYNDKEKYDMVFEAIILRFGFWNIVRYEIIEEKNPGERIFKENTMVSISEEYLSTEIDGYALLIKRRRDLETKWSEKDGEEYEVWEGFIPASKMLVLLSRDIDCTKESDFTIEPDDDDDLKD